MPPLRRHAGPGLTRTSLPAPSRLAYAASAAVAFGVGAVSIGGLTGRSGSLYLPDTGLVLVSRAGDLANLAVTAPALLATMWQARRGSMLGLLLWPGALFYVVYVYAIYAFAATFTTLVFAHVGIALISAVTLVRLLAGISQDGVSRQLSTLPARGIGLALVAISVLAYAGLIGTGLAILHDSDQIALRPQWVVDCLIGTPALLASGALLQRRRPLGTSRRQALSSCPASAQSRSSSLRCSTRSSPIIRHSRPSSVSTWPSPPSTRYSWL
jgi:hypothetical protein